MRLLKLTIKLFFASICALVIACVVYINIKLHYRPQFKAEANQSVNLTLLKQLNYLGNRLQDGAALDMQHLYPEGFIFTHALYALAWCDVADRLPESTFLKTTALERIKASWKAIDSPTGRMPFDPDLSPSYGIFYRGWSNYVLGRQLKLRSDPDAIVIFEKNCIDLAASFSRTLYPGSYHDMSWPADALPAIASLKLHDQLFRPQYESLINDWLSRVGNSIGPNEMIPHATDSQGLKVEGPRGSSLSLMLVFLAEIDPAFARAQFALYQRKYVDTLFGLSFVREYAKGQPGRGDIDSGPVVFGIGSAATIVGLRTLNTFGSSDHAASIAHCIEAFGVPQTSVTQKKYLFGQLLIADVFIAWSLSKNDNVWQSQDTSWRRTFHWYSAALSSALLLAIVFLLKQRRHY